MILSDRELTKLIGAGMLSNCSLSQIREVEGVGKVISKGLSAYGVDLTANNTFLLPNPEYSGVIDPKNFHADVFTEIYVDDHKAIAIPAKTSCLLSSKERFSMPRNVMGLCYGKSTYARCGILYGITPIEPGWTGYLTIEIFNSMPRPTLVYANEGICQVIFLTGEEPTVSYADRNGKYQEQSDKPTVARL